MNKSVGVYSVLAASLAAIVLGLASCPDGFNDPSPITGASPGASPASSPTATPTPSPRFSPGAPMDSDAKAIFLHHSTGSNVWGGGVPAAVAARNASLGVGYAASERAYPDSPWPWANYPSDYYRLWIGGEGSAADPNIQTLEAICAGYDLVIWKHCYPVMNIGADEGSPDPASPNQTLGNYKAVYEALKTKMRAFPNNRFIVWTGAVELSTGSNQAEAQRLKDFRDWVVNTWDEAGDNIFIFDFWTLETEGGLYLLPEHAANAGTDNHPNEALCAEVAPKFAECMVDVLQGRGDTDPITGL